MKHSIIQILWADPAKLDKAWNRLPSHKQIKTPVTRTIIRTALNRQAKTL